MSVTFSVDCFSLLEVPQFTDAVQRINVTEGDDFVLHYEITYTDGIGSALLVDNVQIRNDSIGTIINCNTTDGTCNTHNIDNMRISPSIVDSSDRINANVTVSNAVSQDGGEYLAIASATLSVSLLYTSSYTATIIVEITGITCISAHYNVTNNNCSSDPTPTPAVSTIASLSKLVHISSYYLPPPVSASPSLSALPTNYMQPSSQSELCKNTYCGQQCMCLYIARNTCFGMHNMMYTYHMYNVLLFYCYLYFTNWEQKHIVFSCLSDIAAAFEFCIM